MPVTGKHIEARNKPIFPTSAEQSQLLSLADDLKSHVIGQDAVLIRLPKLSAVIVLIVQTAHLVASSS